MPKCIICTLDKPLTDEHIVPEFMGGGLIYKGVCKSCNDSMGTSFEGRLSNTFLYKSNRHLNDIYGKRDTAASPFTGTHVDSTSGHRFTVSNDGSLKAQPNINIEDDTNGVAVSVTLDQKDYDKLPSMLATKLERYLKSKGKGIDKGQIAKMVKQLLASTDTTTDSIENPCITQDFELNFHDIELLHVKVAYELACYHFGSDYMLDPVAESLRLSLYNKSVDNNVMLDFTMERDPLSGVVDDEHHWVIYLNNFVYVRMWGIWTLFNFESEKKGSCPLWGVIYRFCYKTQTFKTLDTRNFN